MSKLQKNIAFTLAEVLITLGIIGVVAALTIPTLISNYQKQETITKLKKVYSEFSLATKQVIYENGGRLGFTSNETDNFALFKDEIMSKIKYSKYCVASDWSNDCAFYRSLPNYKETVTTNTSNHFNYSRGDVYTLADGTWIEQWGYLGYTIMVDINGAKAPNKFGQDFFLFSLDDTKGVNFDNIHGGGYCDKINDSYFGYGAMCFKKIVQDGWQIKDDYPWDY